MMPMPVMVMKEGTKREEGKNALEQNIGAGAAIAKTVRTTLGPKGMDKMLVDAMGDTIITNDGVTILKEIDVDHPAAKMVVEAAKTQDDECGDGTTTAVILTGELLEKALPLMKKNIHPTVICEGYGLALDKAKEFVDLLARPVSPGDDGLLHMIASTSMTGKHTNEHKVLLASFVVDILLGIQDQSHGKVKIDLDMVAVIKQKGRSVSESTVLKGLIVHMGRLSKGMPKEISNPRIALFNAPLGVKGTGTEMSMSIESAEEFQKMLDYEEGVIEQMITRFKDAEIDAVFTTKAVSDDAIAALEREGLVAASRIPEDDMERLSKMSGGPILSNWKNLTTDDTTIGTLEAIVEDRINDDPHLIFTDFEEDACPIRTVLLRGASDHVLDEIERGFHDAITTTAKAYEDGEYLTGGGSVFAEIAQGLRQYKNGIGGRSSYAVEAFADACEAIPMVLAENIGLDPIEAEIALRSAHSNGKTAAGISTTGVEDMSGTVAEPKRVVVQALKIAVETASMILRIDDIIAMSAGDLGAGPTGAGAPGRR